MRILVIDDNETHRAAAQAQLAEHELTVVGTYDEGQEQIERGGFEAVLVDLMLPASSRAQGKEGMQLVGQEMPIGIFLALLATRHGAQYVGVLTDTNHHDHPASACLDMFHTGNMNIDGTKVVLVNSGFIGHYAPDNMADDFETMEPYFDEAKQGWRCHQAPDNAIYAKNWRTLLRYLLTDQRAY